MQQPGSIEIPDPESQPAPEIKSRKPTLSEVFKILIPVAAKWKDIGALLELNEGALNNIDADQRAAIGGMREMLIHWLKQVEPAPTIKALAEAVKHFNPEKAKEITALE